jgi:uncharacterized protein with ParB-like and HNH nuclease domain
MKKVLFFVIFISLTMVAVYAQEQQEQAGGIAGEQQQEQKLENKIISGEIEKIADDGSYIVIGGQQIATTAAFIEEAFFEVGDKVKVEVISEEGSQTPKAVKYEYDFEADSTVEE